MKERNPADEALLNIIVENENTGIKHSDISNANKSIYEGFVNINYELNGGKYQHEVTFDYYIKEFTKSVKDILDV